MTPAPQTAPEQSTPAQTPNLATIVTPGSNPLVPQPEILRPDDKQKHAASLDDKDLLAHVQTTLYSLRDDLPYLREAHKRFAQPGQRVPVEGQPTWTEWVKANLHVGMRTVQRWLEEPKPKKEKKVRPVKALKNWQEAQFRANDLVTAVTRLKTKVPVGTDTLLPALRELAAMVGCQLAEPASKPERKLEPTVSILPCVTHVAGVGEDELGPRKRQESNKETNALAASRGWGTDGHGRSVYEGFEDEQL